MTSTPHHLAVFVADEDASVAFYRRAFGFREVYRFDALHPRRAIAGKSVGAGSNLARADSTSRYFRCGAGLNPAGPA
jgi:catechol 2,3-dioxygenase-like lactoylglutathione lyase family enzyme